MIATTTFLVKRLAVSAGLFALLANGPAMATSPAEKLAEKFSRSSAEQQKLDEQEMLARARREAQSRKAQPQVPDPALAVRKPTSSVVNIGKPAAPEMSANEAQAIAKQRQDELQRLSEKLRKASQQRVAKPAAPVEGPWTTEVAAAPKIELDLSERSALGAPVAKLDLQDPLRDSRVAVLIVMTPGDRGIRRFDRSAEPVLCAGDGCYVSNGPGVAARHMSGQKALRSIGPRAGACTHQLGCVFRGVDLGAQPAFVQPVDLRLVNHDLREPKQVTADTTCRVAMGRLTCQRPILSQGYVMWVVPETIADKAGPELLARALGEGLIGTRSAEAPSLWR